MMKLLLGIFIFGFSNPVLAGSLLCQSNGTCDKDGNPIQPPAYITADPRSQAFSSLTCDTLKGSVRLDLRNQTAKIDIYCHAMGCVGAGKIVSHESDFFGDTFLLEMIMQGSTRNQYIIVRAENSGKGEILNYRRDSALFNCIRE